MYVWHCRLLTERSRERLLIYNFRYYFYKTTHAHIRRLPRIFFTIVSFTVNDKNRWFLWLYLHMTSQSYFISKCYSILCRRLNPKPCVPSNLHHASSNCYLYLGLLCDIANFKFIFVTMAGNVFYLTVCMNTIQTPWRAYTSNLSAFCFQAVNWISVKLA